MIYKEITLGQALEMVNKGETKDLFYQAENGNDLYIVNGKRFYLETLKQHRFFKRIPKEPELQSE